MKSVETPVLSVRLMTYNHADFIAQAIEGALNQDTNFNYEIVIGDDFSKDGTLEICKAYAQKYPDKIVLLKRPLDGAYHHKRQQLGRLYNFTNLLDNCRGKYIALLDGDDYWTDANKLQRQVDFLEANKDYVITFHNTDVIKGNRIRKSKSLRGDSTYSLKNHIIGYPVVRRALSMVLRKSAIPSDFPKKYFYDDSPEGEWTLCLHVALSGKIKYFKDTMGVYRIHSSNIWGGNKNRDAYKTMRNYKKELIENEFKNNSKISKYLRTSIEIDKFLSIENKKLDKVDARKLFRTINKKALLNLQPRALWRIIKALKHLYIG